MTACTPARAAVGGLLLLVLLVASAARSQDDVEDVYRDLGTAHVEEKAGSETSPELGEGVGRVFGQVFDAEAGTPVEGVTVILVWPLIEEGGEPRQDVRVTDADGVYEFDSIPPGSYSLSFVKAGFRSSTMTNYQVQPGQLNRADFPLPPLPSEASGEILELDAYVVEASTVSDMLALDLRMDSDVQLNIMSAEDLSKFAATDVADALKRVAGVNIVEGQFAIIRGLEDRYSSTLYNGAPVPSPDPDRQSVQLDLFPSEVVDDLVVAKTFVPSLPSNSAGGSIDIVTHDYPEHFELKIKGAGGFNDNAWDRFLDYQSGSPVGNPTHGSDTRNGEFGTLMGGRREFFGREFRFKTLYNWQTHYDTAEGFQEKLEPRLRYLPGESRPSFVRSFQSGGLSLGELDLSAGRFDLTTSGYAKQQTFYGGLGFDLDEAGNHRIDGSVFLTKKDEEIVQLKENGFFTGFDYDRLARSWQDQGRIGEGGSDFHGRTALGAWISRATREQADDPLSKGALWFTNFAESDSFSRNRKLDVYQLNGDHTFEALGGLHVTWATNYAKTSQNDESIGSQYFFEPCGFNAIVACPEGYVRDPTFLPTRLPAPVESLGPGVYASTPGILFSSNDIHEKQYFGRLDAEYEISLWDRLDLTLSSGLWYEHARRNVSSSFLQNPTARFDCFSRPNCTGSTSQFAILGETPQEMGRTLLGELATTAGGNLAGIQDSINDSKREIKAWNLGAKGTLWDDLDLLAGFRLEKIYIASNNDPFTGEFDQFDGAPKIFPSSYLLFDRFDNPNRPVESLGSIEGQPPNDEILGIDVPLGPCLLSPGGPVDPDLVGQQCVDLYTQEDIDGLINGLIDEKKYLPMVGLTYRAWEGLTLRGSWSKTVARPSFREMGFYVSVEPGTDDLVIGNPQLGLSDVESWDVRAEYVYGEQGDLFAVSGFHKKISNPIESIVVRDPTNAELSSAALYRTFFNNENEGSLWGLEVEARKNLGFLGPEFLGYFTVGGNYTYINAHVDRSQAEIVRSEPFFGTLPDEAERFAGLEQSRRLFGQPEWIANADITFDHPGWGTRLTLAWFAISDVLDASGSANLGPGGQILSFTPDRYVDGYDSLDLIASETVPLDLLLPGEWTLPGEVSFKFSLKNLTDSKRRLIYDPEQTSQTFTERSVKVGRDYKFTLSYSLEF